MLSSIRLLREGTSKNTEPVMVLAPGSSNSTNSDYDLNEQFIEAMSVWMREEPTTVLTEANIDEQIRLYEQHYGFTSEQMLRRVEDGTAPEDFELTDWRILLKHR